MSTQITLPGRITDNDTLLHKSKQNFNEIEYHIGKLYQAADNVSSDNTIEITQKINSAIFIGLDADKPSI